VHIFLSARQFHPPFKGGVDVYADRLGRELLREGHEVSYLAFDLASGGKDGKIEVMQDDYQGSDVWRFTLASGPSHEAAFQLGYDRKIGDLIRGILEKSRPDLFIVLNFYLSTLASVEAAHQLGIPVSHIATDFIPVCRRASLIRWDGEPCLTGESLKSCASCFVSHRRLGRYAAATFGQLSDESLVNLARREKNAGQLNPLHLIKPYLKQVSLMDERTATLAKLRDQIEHVFAPTEYTAREFLANGYHPEQVSVLPFAVEENSLLSQVEHVEADHTRFLFIGRLQPYKGAHVLVEAFNGLADPRGATLDIYGVPDGHQNYFDQLRAAMETNDRVQFRGQIKSEDLGRAFASADYFVLPSIWHENSPLILLDALQSRTPVIASEIGGVTDTIIEGQNGFLFLMGDVDALRRVLQNVINQPSLRDQLRLGSDLPMIEKYARRILEKSIPSAVMAAAASPTL
jgi:glycosyltransferase involved in cell wall biosynthesis